MTEEFLKCRLGFIGNSDGSAYVSQGTYTVYITFKRFFYLSIYYLGKTAVAVSVVGPFEPKSSKCLYDRGTVDVTFRRKTGSISINKITLYISE